MAESIKVTNEFWHQISKKPRKRKRLFPTESNPTDDHAENIKKENSENDKNPNNKQQKP